MSEIKIEESSNGFPVLIKDINLSKGLITYQSSQAVKSTLNPEPWVKTRIAFNWPLQQAELEFEAPELGSVQRQRANFLAQGNRISLLKIEEKDPWHCLITLPENARTALGLDGPEAVGYTIEANTTGYGKPPGPGGLLDVFVNIHGVNPTDPSVAGTIAGQKVLVLPLVRSALVRNVRDPNPATTKSRNVTLELELTNAEIALIKVHEHRGPFTFSPVDPPLGAGNASMSAKIKNPCDIISAAVKDRFPDVVADYDGDGGTFTLPSVPGKVGFVNGTGRNGRHVFVVTAEIERSGHIHWLQDRVEQECYTTDQAAALVTNLLAVMNIKREMSVFRREILAKSLCDLVCWFPVALCGAAGAEDSWVWCATGVRGVSIHGIGTDQRVSVVHSFHTVPDFKTVHEVYVRGNNLDTPIRWLRHEIGVDDVRGLKATTLP